MVDLLGYGEDTLRSIEDLKGEIKNKQEEIPNLRNKLIDNTRRSLLSWSKRLSYLDSVRYNLLEMYETDYRDFLDRKNDLKNRYEIKKNKWDELTIGRPENSTPEKLLYRDDMVSQLSSLSLGISSLENELDELESAQRDLRDIYYSELNTALSDQAHSDNQNVMLLMVTIMIITILLNLMDSRELSFSRYKLILFFCIISILILAVLYFKVNLFDKADPFFRFIAIFFLLILILFLLLSKRKQSELKEPIGSLQESQVETNRLLESISDKLSISDRLGEETNRLLTDISNRISDSNEREKEIISAIEENKESTVKLLKDVSYTTKKTKNEEKKNINSIQKSQEKINKNQVKTNKLLRDILNAIKKR